MADQPEVDEAKVLKPLLTFESENNWGIRVRVVEIII